MTLARAARDADALEKAVETRDARLAELRRARSKLVDGEEGALGGEEPAPGADRRWGALRELRDRAASDLANVQRAEASEQRRAVFAAEHEDILGALAATEAAVDRHGIRAEELPAALLAARAAHDEAAGTAAQRAERLAAVRRADRVAEAAALADRLVPRIAEAEAVSAARATELAEAAERVSGLLTRRLAGMAGELATGLRAGEPCAVCGATSHPAPAEHRDPVSDEEIAAAEERQSRAQRDFETARDAERALAEQRAAAVSVAGGLSSSDADEAARSAKNALADAERAESSLDSLRLERDRLEEELAAEAAALAAAREEVARLKAEATASAGRLSELDAEIARERGNFDSVADRSRAVGQLHSAAEAALEAALEAEGAAATRNASAEEATSALENAGFASEAEARAAAIAEPALARIESEIEAHTSESQRTEGVLADPGLAGLPEEPAPVAALAAELAAAEKAASEAAARETAGRERLADRRVQLARVDEQLGESSAADAALDQLRRLADAVQGKEPNTRRMRLEAFVLAARLEAIVEAANERLGRMVGGRYRLQHDDGPRSRGRQSGLGLAVFDEYTGRVRSTDSLSGGETFLASLALALGLADVVTAETGGIRLDTLFIDEGFGTLDPDALDQALATLDTLREGGRTVALISHVAELRERLPAQLEVIVDDRGVSALRGEGVIAADAAKKEDS